MTTYNHDLGLPISTIAVLDGTQRRTDGLLTFGEGSYISLNNTSYRIYRAEEVAHLDKARFAGAAFGHKLYVFDGQNYQFAPTAGRGGDMYVAVAEEA